MHVAIEPHATANNIFFLASFSFNKQNACNHNIINVLLGLFDYLFFVRLFCLLNLIQLIESRTARNNSQCVAGTKFNKSSVFNLYALLPIAYILCR